MQSWIEFWNADHSIYVNDRHKAMHAQGIARDIVSQLPASSVLLDYGCGEALYTEVVAAHARRVDLYDGAPAIRDGLRRRFAGLDRVRVLEPLDIEADPGASYDVVIANSLIQYLSREEFVRCLVQWRRLLKPGGVLFVADVVPAGQSPLADAVALLRFAARGGFFFAAVSGLIRTALSDYRKIRSQLGLSTYAEGEMLDLLAKAGYEGGRVHPNFGHNQSRMTFKARPLSAA